MVPVLFKLQYKKPKCLQLRTRRLHLQCLIIPWKHCKKNQKKLLKRMKLNMKTKKFLQYRMILKNLILIKLKKFKAMCNSKHKNNYPKSNLINLKKKRQVRFRSPHHKLKLKSYQPQNLKNLRQKKNLRPLRLKTPLLRYLNLNKK